MNAPVQLNNDAGNISRRIAPSFERKRVRAYIWLMLADIGGIVAAFVLAGAIYRGLIPDRQALLQAWLFLPLYLTIALYQRVYSIRGLTDGVHAAKRVLLAVIVAAALLNFLAFYARFNTSFSRGSFTIGIGLSAIFLAAIHLAAARMLRKRWGPVAQNIAIIDAGGPQFALDYAKTVNAGEAGLAAKPNDPAMLARLAGCLKNQEKALVSCPAPERAAWTEMLRSIGLHGEIITDAEHEIAILGVSKYDSQDRAGLVVSTGPLGLRARVFKRGFDIAVAGGVLFVSWPLLLLAAVAIKIEDGGPVLFIQQRMGRGHQMFSMFKLRTMRVDCADMEGTVSTGRQDERVTRVGMFLRRTSVDELPQLLNVLLGDMSIVGPRPHALGSQAGDKLFWEVDQKYWHRHSLKPGMTGLAQIRGLRGATSQESDLTERLKADLEYISEWSLLGDAVIVARTLSVLRGERVF